jgi:Fe-Mn family superoxide dismutase
MHTYEPKKFKLPSLDGISDESVKQHIGLYEGYVKNFNAMSALIGELVKDHDKNALAIAELIRRRSFEFDGMRLHEHYFTQFEDGANPLNEASAFGKAIAKEYRSLETFTKSVMATVAGVRGPGWAMLYLDPEQKELLTGFSGEQHQGHFVTLPIVLALDVWEHAYLLDYGASGRAKYVEAFFKNLNWSVIEKRFDGIMK